MFSECGNRKCKTQDGKPTRVLTKIAVHSVGRKVYCTVKCLHIANGTIKPQRLVRVP